LGIPPWYYFQINAEWYNKKKGFYSKIDMDARIPKKWRLKQDYFDKNNLPETFPVFLKPEWGQNSNGIIKINNKQDFLNFDPKNGKIPYILQYAAHFALSPTLAIRKDGNSCRYFCKISNSFSQKSCVIS
jgi:hypothetical protein